ncbi:MAG: YkgJ family cysteine cluster protein [Phycisphaerae bacterium]|nr:YkgJ family cysteine cluster protein [Phycisphaerae bacterium]
MNTTDNDTPWYAAGLAFECLECGRCCAGPEEGYVWVSDEEIRVLADFLRLTDKAFRARYVRRVGRRQSLVEKKKQKDCIFLERGKCTVYSVRPVQCRTWPFWAMNLASPEDWSYAASRCMGMNRGTVFPLDEIQTRANKTKA